MEIEAASRWRLGGRQLPKEVLSRKHLCSLITPLLFITTAKHRVQVITVNHILLPFIILSLGEKNHVVFLAPPLLSSVAFHFLGAKVEMCGNYVLDIGFYVAAAKPLKQIFGIGRERLPLIRASVSLSNYCSARRGARGPNACCLS